MQSIALFGPHTFPALPGKRQSRRIYPVFLPFSGCPQRCLFCAQDKQTGRGPAPVRALLEQEHARLKALASARLLASARPLAMDLAMELAFFGGTFTALPEKDIRDCLDFYTYWADAGLFSSFRCSTRPDALSPAILQQLRSAGCAMVELGVQSFQDAALERSCRGYTGATAQKACALVKDSGLQLGVQLMPGMPGLHKDGAEKDVRTALNLAADCARLYPCLVIDGTGLADAWRAGTYQPWALEDTVDFLAKACTVMEGAGCAVIRMALCEEPGLANTILAGPHHPELGNMARGLALFYHIRAQVEVWKENQRAKDATTPPPIQLLAPRRVQGMFWGHARSLEAAYAKIGLTRQQVFWQDRDNFVLGSGIL